MNDTIAILMIAAANLVLIPAVYQLAVHNTKRAYEGRERGQQNAPLRWRTK